MSLVLSVIKEIGIDHKRLSNVQKCLLFQLCFLLLGLDFIISWINLKFNNEAAGQDSIS